MHIVQALNKMFTPGLTPCSSTLIQTLVDNVSLNAAYKGLWDTEVIWYILHAVSSRHLKEG